MDHTIDRFTESWSNNFGDSGSYTNNRRFGWSYDADGRIASIDTRSYGYDAAGQTVSLTGQRWTPRGDVPTGTTSDFDGDGQQIREISDGSFTTYYLRSSALRGAIVEELDSNGQKGEGYVYSPGGGLIATQVGQGYVTMKERSPAGASQYEFFVSNTSTGADIRYEFDPAGATVPLTNHSPGHGGSAGDIENDGGPADSRFGDMANTAAGCMDLLDGVPVPCDWLDRMAQGDALQLKIGNTKHDIQLFSGTTVWVDAWENFTIPSDHIAQDSDGNTVYADTSGTRNVGYFVTLSDGSPLPSSIPMRPLLPQKPWPNLGFLPPHDVIGDKWYPKIRSMVNDIFGSDACRQAFKDAGLDLKALGDKGFLIGSSTLLTDNSITDAQLGLPSAARQAAVQKLNSSSLNGLTISLNSGSDQRPRMFFTQDAFTAGGLFSSADSSLRQVLIHELIHAAGAPGKDAGWWGYLGYDDLSYMQKQYNKIEKACGGS